MLLFIALIVLASAAAPSRPKISPVFSAHGRVMLKSGKIHHLEGRGRWHVNPAGVIVSGGGKGLGVEDYFFPGGHKIFFLERYDLHADYEYRGEGRNQTCHSRNTTGDMPDPWRWLITATYDGRRGHGRHTVDVWNNTFSDKRGTAQLAVAVLSHDPSRPVFFGRIFTDEKGVKHDFFIEIEQWDSTTPNNNEFHVPYECSKVASKPHSAVLQRPFMKLMRSRPAFMQKMLNKK